MHFLLYCLVRACQISLFQGYPHNTGAYSGSPGGWCSVGGYWKGPEQNHSLPTYIRDAGYMTGLFGKELNVNDDSFVSPGWDRFFALGGSSEGHYYSDWYCDQGKRYTAGPDEYMTQTISQRARAFMQDALQQNKPFFAYVAPHAPHTRATPGPDSRTLFQGVKAPRVPSWNITSRDKHWLVRSQPPMDDRCILASDSLYQNRLRTLIDVDEMVGDIADLLQQHNALNNTYILFTSDHGFHLGEFNMDYFKPITGSWLIKATLQVRV
eukprot:TRINITY_DN11027_c0_g1_i9.p1 TRINITY_DN11027_c0_g1~~TRINITY_DN11027_c0_g1_i9.p1  ORF type:complete len:267 (+),score=42.99 TRINITY_DN11027_c0_g1_i9:789-1589(+)